MRTILPPLALLLAGCPPSLDSQDSAGDSLPPTDTAETASPVFGWPPYEAVPSWIAEDHGYGTGAAWADIDGDGALDLVVSYGNDMSPGPLAVHLAREGSLGQEADWASTVEAYHAHLAVGDVDGDGLADVVVARFLGTDGFDAPGGISLYLNQGGYLPDEPSWESAAGFYCFSVALGDMDNDGDLDLAAATGEPYHHDAEPDLLFLNEGGAFTEPPAWQSAEPTWSMDVGFFDANLDGALDLAFARRGSPHAVHLNTGAGLAAGLPEGSPSLLAEGESFEGNSLDFGDVDGDGWPDLAVTDNQQLGGPGTVRLFAGPDLTLAWETAAPNADYSAVALADLDDDDDLDLAVGAWWGAIGVHRDEGGLEPEPSWAAQDDSVVAEAFALHDLDGSYSREVEVRGPGPLLALPRPCQVRATSTPGAQGDGYFSAPTTEQVTITCRWSPAPDLLVTDWTRGVGNTLFAHRPAEP
ncbi:MAG: VCBS repeat-containing protein [Pseudomonadota bacterium]